MTGKAFIPLLLMLASCAEPIEKPASPFEDIKGFFEAEVSRLAEIKKTVNKTVKRNEVSETKNNVPVIWKDELALFIESDINKPAWRNSYKTVRDSSNIYYSATEKGLRTRSISIKKNPAGHIIHVSIINETKNYLYQSSESLIYIPDSIYLINKNQDVLFLGNNKYSITGLLKQN